jgi:hypothetical protein
MPDVFGEKTFFTIWVRWRGEIRPFTVEHAMIETEEEVIDAIVQNPSVFAVYRHDHDTPREDVSEDIARLWLARLDRQGYTADDTLPSFIGLHLTNDDIEGVLRSAAA